MKKDISQLAKQKTWEWVNRDDIPPGPDEKPRHVLKGTWLFKLKWPPDDIPLKYKHRYFVHGYLQTSGVDYFKTYAPLVQCSTIRLSLTIILSNNCHTK